MLNCQFFGDVSLLLVGRTQKIPPQLFWVTHDRNKSFIDEHLSVVLRPLLGRLPETSWPILAKLEMDLEIHVKTFAYELELLGLAAESFGRKRPRFVITLRWKKKKTSEGCLSTVLAWFNGNGRVIDN